MNPTSYAGFYAGALTASGLAVKAPASSTSATPAPPSSIPRISELHQLQRQSPPLQKNAPAPHNPITMARLQSRFLEQPLVVARGHRQNHFFLRKGLQRAPEHVDGFEEIRVRQLELLQRSRRGDVDCAVTK